MQDLAILFLRTQYCLLINSYWILRQLCCCCNNLWMETNNAETRQHTSAKTNNGGATWRCCWKIYSNGKMAAIRTLWVGSTPKFHCLFPEQYSNPTRFHENRLRTFRVTLFTRQTPAITLSLAWQR